MRQLGLLIASLALATPAYAVRHVVTLSGTVDGKSADQRYEFADGFLQTHYGLPLVNGSALPPVERAVAESRTPGSGQRTRGFHVPTSATGLPVADGGTGVTQALTNVGSLSPGNITTPWVDDQDVAFTLTRTGTTITYSIANSPSANVWSHTAASVAEINAIQFRMRSAGSNSVFLSDILLSQGGTTVALGCAGAPISCGVGQTGAFSASAGDVHISLFDQINGDFTLTGKWRFDLSPSRAGNNAQIKLLAVPDTGVVPEPSSWAMLIAGFGLVGATLRRRRSLAMA
jgi:hypothetical protein